MKICSIKSMTECYGNQGITVYDETGEVDLLATVLINQQQREIEQDRADELAMIEQHNSAVDILSHEKIGDDL